MFIRTTLNTEDIMTIIGVKRRKAQRIKSEVIDYSKAKGRLPISNRKCLLQDFAELYGVSVDIINLALEKKALKAEPKK